MNTAAQDYQPSGLRVSDSDRDRAIAELSEHFQAGRLSTEEFEERTGRALQARTASDLAELFTDLPRQPGAIGAPTAGPAPRPTTGPGLALPPASSPARSGGIPVIPLIIAVAIVAGGFASGHAIVGALVPVLIALFIIRRIVDGDRHDYRDHRDRQDRRDRRHDRGDRW